MISIGYQSPVDTDEIRVSATDVLCAAARVTEQLGRAWLCQVALELGYATPRTLRHRLFELQQRGELQLRRCDLIQAERPELVRLSRIVHPAFEGRGSMGEVHLVEGLA